MITACRLRELLHYDPDTGIFTRLVSTACRVKVGDIAGGINAQGYLVFRVDGKSYRAHRLAWLYMTGVWPKADIDHRDLNRTNNRWGNLREATRSENMGNTRAYANNTSGFKGVCWDKRGRKWRATIRVAGKNRYLGMFDCPAAAHATYVAAAADVFGEFSRGGLT